MLQITIPPVELWDERKEEFFHTKEQTLQLEHSLVSLSKWESRWEKSFLFTKEKTTEEVLDYIRCMTLTQNVKPETYYLLTQDNITEVENYIKAPMTATTFSENKKGKPNREIVTAEIIYQWMIALNIPFECRKWHLNQLLTLIKVCTIKSEKPKNLSQREIMAQNAALNEARKKKLNSKG